MAKPERVLFLGCRHDGSTATVFLSGGEIVELARESLPADLPAVGETVPGATAMFDRLVEVSGAESISWPAQLDCCGSPVWGVNDELSMDLTQKKISDAAAAEADYLCVSCPFCQLQFDRVQNTFLSKRNGNSSLPSIIYTQLLGLSLGIDAERLGIHQNEMDVSGILRFQAEE